jgi:hypothetical protein
MFDKIAEVGGGPPMAGPLVWMKYSLLRDVSNFG